MLSGWVVALSSAGGNYFLSRESAVARNPPWGRLLLAEQGLCVGRKKGSGVPWASFQM